MPEERTEVVTKRKEEVCKLSMKRTSAGVELIIKSKVFEEFFKGLHRQADQYFTGQTWTGEAYSVPRNVKVDGVSFDAWGDGLITTGSHGSAGRGSVNLSMLRARGLTEGYTLLIPGVWSREAMERWFRTADATVRKLYSDHIKSVEFRLTITSEVL